MELKDKSDIATKIVAMLKEFNLLWDEAKKAGIIVQIGNDKDTKDLIATCFIKIGE